MDKPRLLTIPMSHYCEKARWGLERLAIDYKEVRHLQGFHWLWAFAWAQSPKVPILRMDGQTIKDSTEILHYLDARTSTEARLFPDEPTLRNEVVELEELFDGDFGRYTRLWVYANYLPHSHDVVATAGQGAPAWERKLMPLMLPLMRRVLAWRLGDFSAEHVAACLVYVRRVLTQVEERLADGRRYLCGERFTAADLTFACMAAPLVLPPEYGIRLPTIDEAPSEMQPDLMSFRDRPAGQFALRLFREDRRRKAV